MRLCFKKKQGNSQTWLIRNSAESPYSHLTVLSRLAYRRSRRLLSRLNQQAGPLQCSPVRHRKHRHSHVCLLICLTSFFVRFLCELDFSTCTLEMLWDTLAVPINCILQGSKLIYLLVSLKEFCEVIKSLF